MGPAGLPPWGPGSGGFVQAMPCTRTASIIPRVDYAAVAAHQVAPVPEGLDMRAAGGLATTGLTALQGIDQALHVKPADTVLIVGASGGVGTLAVQFARLRGARVLAVASGDDGVALVRSLSPSQPCKCFASDRQRFRTSLAGSSASSGAMLGRTDGLIAR